MVKKFFKKRSKRVQCRLRYKVEKKVKEHNRKVKKDAKNKSKKWSRSKDPGVPNTLPFKDKIIEEARERKEIERQLMRKRQEEDRNRLLMAKRGLTEMVEMANRKGEEFEVKSKMKLKNKKPKEQLEDRSLKTYYREFRKVIEAADVILQVLDARDPLGSRCPQVEESILNSGTNKRMVLILNKIDLVPLDNLKQWLKYLRNEFPTVPFKASTQNQQAHLSRAKFDLKSVNQNVMKTSRSLGADLLMKLLANYCRSHDIKTSIRVGVVGFPNVGKSSIINSLKRSKACNVGAVPGVTKVMQEVHLDQHIVLLDCPGIVMAKDTSNAAAALHNAIKIGTVKEPLKPVEAILARASKTQLLLRYCIPDYKSTYEFLALLAKKKGRLRRKGIPDVEQAARIILHDWNSGKIRFYTHPPELSSATVHVSAELVQLMAKEFDISALEVEEETAFRGMKFIEHNDSLMVKSTGPLESMDLTELPDDSLQDVDDNSISQGLDNSDALSISTTVSGVNSRKSKGKKGEPAMKAKEKRLEKNMMAALEIEGNLQLGKASKAAHKRMMKRMKRDEKRLSAPRTSDEDYDFTTDFK